MQHIRDFCIPSTEPGLTWRIGYHKPAGRPGVVSATEGKLSQAEGGVSFFTAVLHEARRVRYPLTGRATLKAVAAALDEVLATLLAVGMIDAASVDEARRKAFGRAS